MSTRPLKTNPLVVAQQISTGSVLMDVATGDCYELNHVGAQIWSRLASGEEVPTIAPALSAEYGIPIDQAAADVEILMTDLTKEWPFDRRRSMMSSGSFALTTLDNEGLLLDLRTGSLFQLNESATTIWSEWLAGASEDRIAHLLEHTYRIGADEAQHQVREALKVGAEADCAPADFEFLYERAQTGYTFSKDGVALLTVDDRGHFVTANRSALTTRKDIFSVLLSVSPKLAALRGHFVLHASAALVNEGALAFCGVSGAGKTTIVRSLVAGGAKQVCEDKLVLRVGASGVEMILDAEERVWRWAEQSLDDLWSGRAASCGALGELSTGPSVLLKEIGFISADQRAGDRIDGTALSVAGTAGRVFSNLFYGSDVPEIWRGQLRRAVGVANTVKGTLLTMPNGLSALHQATAELARRGSLRS